MKGKREGGVNVAKRKSMKRENWGLFCHGHPFKGSSQGEQSIKAIDRWIEDTST